MKRYRVLLVLALLLVLIGVNVAVVRKERIKTHGELVLLELAPVDPRSLMQGDYMALRFALAEQLDPRASGDAPLVLDARRVARLATGSEPAQLRLRYRVRQGQIWLGTNAYFFEEGSAERFNGARYGEFRLDPDSGEAVLTGLRDQDLRPL